MWLETRYSNDQMAANQDRKVQERKWRCQCLVLISSSNASLLCIRYKKAPLAVKFILNWLTEAYALIRGQVRQSATRPPENLTKLTHSAKDQRKCNENTMG